MDSHPSATRFYLPPVDRILAAPPQTMGAAREHQTRPTVEQRAEWALGLSLESWHMLPERAQIADFMLRVRFMNSMADAPIDIRVLLFSHMCKLAITFANEDFVRAWRILVDAYHQEPPAVRELLKEVIDRVHMKTELYGEGNVKWERSPQT